MKIASSESLNDADYESDASDEESTLSDGALNKSKKKSPKFVSEPNLSVLDSVETPKNTTKRLFRSKFVTSQDMKYKKRYRNPRNTPASCVSCLADQDTGSDMSCTENQCDRILDTPVKSKLHEDEVKYYLTSTPGMSEVNVFDEDCVTPYTRNFRRASMSPITKSTQKLSKAMQVGHFRMMHVSSSISFAFCVSIFISILI